MDIDLLGSTDRKILENIIGGIQNNLIMTINN